RRVEVEAESLYRGYGRTIADDRADLGNAVIGRGGVGLVHARGGAVGQRARRRGGDDDRDGGAGTCGHAADSEGQDAAHGRDPVSGRDEGHARRERVGQGHAGRTRRTVVGHRERISHVIAQGDRAGGRARERQVGSRWQHDLANRIIGVSSFSTNRIIGVSPFVGEKRKQLVSVLFSKKNRTDTNYRH